MMKRVFAFIFMLVLSAGVAAETLYVIDEIRVGLRAEANASSKIVTVAPTGMALELIKTEGSYFLVKTADGKQGWIHKNYTLDEVPARSRIDDVIAAREKLRSENAELKETIAELEASRNNLMDERQQLQGQLQANEAGMQQLRRELAEYEQPGDEQQPPIWMFLAGGAVLLFFIGMILGRSMYKRRMAKRLGGMHF